MNLLQFFMAECNRQTRAINQEEVVINGAKIFGTFGDPQMIPQMERHGYDDEIVAAFIASADQFTSPPVPHQKLIRRANNTEYLIRMVDAKDPVVFTFILADRAP